jgi:YidC/Oxa1 family membrane protein insertase
MNILVAPFINALFACYYLSGNLGWSVVIVTVLVKLLLLPLMAPSMKAAKRMRELQPRLKKLQEKYKGDKAKLATAQMDLYKQEGVNPTAGCLPQILQIAVLLIFYSAFNQVTGFAVGKGNFEGLNQHLIPSFRINQDFRFDLNFFGNNLAQTPAKIFSQGIGMGLFLPAILLLGSGLFQYLSAKMMMPAEVETSSENKDSQDEMMAAMRTQSLYFMPLMTIFIGWNFSLGLLLYWFVNSVTTLGQQWVLGKVNKDQ